MYALKNCPPETVTPLEDEDFWAGYEPDASDLAALCCDACYNQWLEENPDQARLVAARKDPWF